MTPLHVPDKDVIETLPDQRTIQRAKKGVPMPLSDAIRYGVITREEAAEKYGAAVLGQVGPTEVKEGAQTDTGAAGASQLTGTARTTRRGASRR